MFPSRSLSRLRSSRARNACAAIAQFRIDSTETLPRTIAQFRTDSTEALPRILAAAVHALVPLRHAGGPGGITCGGSARHAHRSTPSTYSHALHRLRPWAREWLSLSEAHLLTLAGVAEIAAADVWGPLTSLDGVRGCSLKHCRPYRVLRYVHAHCRYRCACCLLGCGLSVVVWCEGKLG